MKNKKILINKIIFIIGLFIILFGFIASFYMNFIVNRSLWVDEAMFAYSFSTRSLFNLVRTPFEWTQSAPITYIYLVKLLTIVLGNSEIILRLVSFISYIGIIILTFFISKKIFNDKYPIMPAAFVSTLEIMLRYSNEFKVYIFDSLCILLIIYIYYLYNNNKISLFKVSLIYSLIITCSNPSLFTIGSIYIYEFITSILNNKKEKSKKILFYGLFVLIFFVFYYFTYLRSVATDDKMVNFWIDSKFPLIPKNLNDVNKFFMMLGSLFDRFQNNKYIFIVLSLISLVEGIMKKNKYIIIIAINLFLALVASYLGKYPIVDRMWIFIYPIIIILIFNFLNNFINDNSISKFSIIIFICFIFIQSINCGTKYYLNKDNVIISGEELKPNIKYIKDNIKDDEALFVYYHAVPYFQYRMGYKTKKINKSKIIYSSSAVNKNERDKINVEYVSKMDIDNISNEKKCYILISHGMGRDKYLFDSLNKNGYVELISNNNSTPIYYFTSNKDAIKTKIEYNISNLDNNNGVYRFDFIIKNTGKSILNNDYEMLYITDKNKPDINYGLEKNIEISKEIVKSIELDFNDNDEYELQVCNSLGYCYDEFGIEPVIITKEMFVNN